MTHVLITGANRGLGLEFVRQYAGDGADVVACTRDPAKADALKALAAAHRGRVHVHALDATSDASHAALTQALGSTALDLVIANAGVFGPARQGADGVDFAGFNATLDANAAGPLRLALALRDHLARGHDRRFVAITSQMGSIADASGGFYAYRASKAALNMALHALAHDWKADGLCVALVHPGWVQTDMGGAGAPLTPAQSVGNMRRLIAGLTAEHSGRSLAHDGRELPW